MGADNLKAKHVLGAGANTKKLMVKGSGFRVQGLGSVFGV